MTKHTIVAADAAIKLGMAVLWAAVCCLGGCVHHRPTTRPDRATAAYVQGALAYQHGDAETAVSELSEAVQENPDLTMAHVLLGDIYRSRTDYRDAADHYEVAARLDPYDYKNHYNLGITYQFLSRLQEAVACYLRALKLKPTDLNSNMNLGLVYLALNQPDDALAMMQRAVKVDPKSAAAHCNLGVALEAKGNFAAAELEYRRAVELDGQSTVALMDLAGNLIRQGHGADAVAVMRAELKLSDTTGARKRYGDALVLDGLDDDAYRQYAEALRRKPDYWQALNQTGMILLRRYIAGSELEEPVRKQAIATWQRSLELNPNQPQIQALINKWNTTQAFP
jgi:tetratricopeptide (TPR) repeat protein